MLGRLLQQPFLMSVISHGSYILRSSFCVLWGFLCFSSSVSNGSSDGVCGTCDGMNVVAEGLRGSG
jgi:hypothetical protein